MTFQIRDLTLRNFLSIGNVTQSINFDRSDLTLILGENLDLGGDDKGSRNGAGKTSISNALSYAFYGQALTSIKKDNLINRINGKNMLVTVRFTKNGELYTIERGRKPNILTLYKGEVAFETTDNDAQGDSRETQHEIERIIGMTHDMFRQVVVLNTYTDPFLALKANDQRGIIEQLLGITVLSEKAELLKEAIRQSKDIITTEEIRIKSIIESNKRIEDHIASLVRRKTLWDEKHSSDINQLQSKLGSLSTIDIDQELKSHSELQIYASKKKDINNLTAEATRLDSTISRETESIRKLTSEIKLLENHECHSCGQKLHNAKQVEILSTKQGLLNEVMDRLDEAINFKKLLTDSLASLGELGPAPTLPYYEKIENAHDHRSSVLHLQQQIDRVRNEINPYTDQISEIQTAALSTIDYTIINNTTKLKDHQEFLLKLLTSKDSFIRKRIIDQNLTFLNARLSYYLAKIGLPHVVTFQNDLSVSIEELGNDLDFGNLSRGEQGRLILSLNFSFRDVWENLYEPINLLFIDELLDSGLDASGVENSMGILKKMARDSNKSVWLISHKDELTSRVANILSVVKSNGFTEFRNDDFDD
jgi:DNA repair exonuclease SbcCD ATPase subunit